MIYGTNWQQRRLSLWLYGVSVTLSYKSNGVTVTAVTFCKEVTEQRITKLLFRVTMPASVCQLCVSTMDGHVLMNEIDLEDVKLSTTIAEYMSANRLHLPLRLAREAGKEKRRTSNKTKSIAKQN